MSSPNGSAPVTGAPGPTPEQDAEDLGLVLREARAAQGVSAAELARRAGLAPGEVLDLEDGRIVPARPGFTACMRALGFVA